MGYEAASVRDVIRRSGLSVGAFYNYYRSKEEVYQALADDGARRFRLILRAEYEKASDFDSFLRAALHAFFSFQVTEHEAWQTQRPVGERHHPQIRVETPEQFAVFEEVKALIVDRIEHGMAPNVDADYLAAACIGVARELNDRMLERRPIDVDATTEFAIKMIKGGVDALPRLDA
jgi:AcrR family transcriptional regulator